jgi:hypothetical protein
MSRWDYDVVLDSWQFDLQQGQGASERERTQALQILNRAAEDRWELVTVEKFTEVRSGNKFAVTFVYFFKRER